MPPSLSTVPAVIRLILTTILSICLARLGFGFTVGVGGCGRGGRCWAFLVSQIEELGMLVVVPMLFIPKVVIVKAEIEVPFRAFLAGRLFLLARAILIRVLIVLISEVVTLAVRVVVVKTVVVVIIIFVIVKIILIIVVPVVEGI